METGSQILMKVWFPKKSSTIAFMRELECACFSHSSFEDSCLVFEPSGGGIQRKAMKALSRYHAD